MENLTENDHRLLDSPKTNPVILGHGALVKNEVLFLPALCGQEQAQSAEREQRGGAGFRHRPGRFQAPAHQRVRVATGQVRDEQGPVTIRIQPIEGGEKFRRRVRVQSQRRKGRTSIRLPTAGQRPGQRRGVIAVQGQPVAMEVGPGLVVERHVEAVVVVAGQIRRAPAGPVEQHGEAGTVGEIGIEITVVSARDVDEHVQVRQRGDGGGEGLGAGQTGEVVVGNAQADAVVGRVGDALAPRAGGEQQSE